MKGKKRIKTEMYERIIDFMNRHLAAWKGMEKLSGTLDNFVRNYKTINDLRVKSEQPLDHLMKRHTEKRKELIRLLLPVIEVVTIYLKDIGDKKNRDAVSKNAKKINKLDDEKLIRLAASMISTKQKNKEDLLKYGFRDDMSNKISILSIELAEIDKEMKNTLEKKERAARAMKKLIAENDKLLKDRMDKFMQLFQVDNPHLLEEYKQARNLVKAEKAKPAP